jgi:hypothetical protein
MPIVTTDMLGRSIKAPGGIVNLSDRWPKKGDLSEE